MGKQKIPIDGPISREELIRIIKYDKNAGTFHWRVGISTKTIVGKIAGWINCSGYRQIGIYGRKYMAHRIAWMYTYGRWPVSEIDHIDGDKSNNKINNLREATRGENNQNLSHRSDNKSGYRGVCWDKNNNKWIVFISYKNKQIHIGRFDDKKEAYKAYLDRKAEIHKFCPVVRNR